MSPHKSTPPIKNGIISPHGLSQAASNYLFALTLLFAGLAGVVSAQTLQHEWSFNESGGTTASDAVAGANITLYGNTSLGGGVLTLPGNSGDYAQFPNGILSTNNSITIETWLTDTGGRTWARAWSFGGSTTGPNNNFIQNNYIDLIPTAGNGTFWTEFNQNAAVDAEANAPLPTGTEEYTVMTYDLPSKTIRLYLNGVQVATATDVTTPASLGFTYNNYIGLDQWNDAPFEGSIDEMRIWSAPVSQRYLAASAVAGPSVVINNLTPTSVSVAAGPGVVISEIKQATVTVTLPQTGASVLPATSDATNWVSGNPNVLRVSSSGLITGVGAGTTTVSATVGGVTGTSSSITVTPQALLHRYSFASDASDSVGGPAWNGTLVAPNGGAAATIADGLILPGNTVGGKGYSGYVSLPNGILTNTTSVTVECWMTQNQGTTWAEVWDFGVNNNVNFSLIPTPPGNNNNGNMEVADNPNNNDIYTASAVAFPNGASPTQYVSFIFNDSTLTGNLYTNGALVATQAYPDHTYTPGNIGGAGGTTQNYLGNDVYGDWQFDGTIYEFRIWNGAVSPLYLAASTVGGPSIVVTNTTPQSLSVSVNTSMVGSQTQQATVSGNFLQVSGVPLTTYVTNWASSAANVLTVNSSGLITAQSGGSARVSATVAGVTQSSALISVSDTAPTILNGPANQSAIVGDKATFSVQALGGNLSYAWSFNGTPIPGATNATLTLPSVAFTAAGTYSVVVSNNISTANVSAVLTVSSPILQHEWSFNESGGSTAYDSIAGSNITLYGSTSLGGGVLNLPGGGGNYAQLPNGIVSSYSNSITIETWLTDNAGQTWARAWSFGGGTNGPNNNFIQNNYIDLIPTAGGSGGLWTEFKENGNVQDVIDGGNVPLATGGEQYITVTYNAGSQTCIVYSNGVQVAVGTGIATTPASLGFTYNNYIGLDQWNDPTFNGTFDEMRIWDGAVSQLYLTASTVAGPGVVITSLTPTSATLTAGPGVVITGTEQATLTVTLPQTGSVELPANANVTNWVSSNPGVLTVNSSGLITGVGVGSATVSATLSGVTATSGSISVTAQTLLHRYSFSNDASDSVGGPAWDGTVVSQGAGTAATIANGLMLPGGGGGGYSGYVTLPDGILTNTTSLTVECWLTQTKANQWAEVWDFAVNDNVNFALIPAPNPAIENNGNLVVAVNPNNDDIYTTSGVALPSGSEQYVSYTFDNSALAGSLYTNGVLVGTQTYPNTSYCPGNIGGAGGTTQNYLGNDVYGDTQFQGTIYEFRIWNGAVTPTYLAASAVAGSGVVVTNTTVQSLSVSVNTSMIAGQTQQAAVTGNFKQVSSVPLTSLVTNWTSSNPAVLTVSSSGLVTAVNGGTATVSATANGMTQSSSSITVNPATIGILHSGASLTLNWPAGTLLLQAPTLLGPWTTNNTAVSPYTVPVTVGNQFFRLLVSP
jgi:uncharacterized protein YjdB